VFAAGVVGDYVGGVISDSILRRTGDLRKARRNVIVAAFLSSAVFLVPIFLTRDLNVIVFSLAGAFFCAELVIGPIWAVPMDIAPKYSGTASGFMNTGSAIAAVLSPLAFGYLADLTGNWHVPFIGSLGLLLLGAALSFFMRVEVPFEQEVQPT
jgi:MFS family permease